MVYMQAQLLGWRPVMMSWLEALPQTVTAAQRAEITQLCDWLIPPMLRASTKEMRQVLPMQEINLAVSCMQLFESLLHEWRSQPKVRSHPGPSPCCTEVCRQSQPGMQCCADLAPGSGLHPHNLFSVCVACTAPCALYSPWHSNSHARDRNAVFLWRKCAPDHAAVLAATQLAAYHCW